MKRKDILKGRLYTHDQHVGVKYLGSRNNRNEPQMVIIDDPHWHLEGDIVSPPKGFEYFWDGFSLVGDK